MHELPISFVQERSSGVWTFNVYRKSNLFKQCKVEICEGNKLAGEQTGASQGGYHWRVGFKKVCKGLFGSSSVLLAISETG